MHERDHDVLEIAKDTLIKFSTEENRAFKSFSPDVQHYFRSHPWPGNVRQLLNVIRNIVVLHDAETVTMDMLPHDFRVSARYATSRVDTATAVSAPAEQLHIPRTEAPTTGQNLDGLIGKTLDEIERIVVEETIASNSGSIPMAARVLDVSPSTLYRKISGWKNQAKAMRADDQLPTS